MPEIIVLGGGVAGLATAVLLARDGHDVTLLERDADPVPATLDDAHAAWSRRGVAQFTQAHILHSRGWGVVEEALPDVADALIAAGGRRFDVLGLMPPAITDRAPRPGDERFVTVTGRRPTIEWVLARTAAEEPGVEVRRGTEAVALLARRTDGLTRVTGVRTTGGYELTADLVVDASGRRSRLPAMLADVGARPVHEEVEDLGFIYYTRFFRSADGALPQFRTPLLTPFDSFSLLTLPADNGTWSLTVYVSAGDRAMKVVRDPDQWSALVRACPAHAHWIDHEPISDVIALGGVVDRYRRFVDADGPIATGVLAVGDAWACTNPSLGRGMTFALVHARYLRDFVRYHAEHPLELAEVWDTVTEAELTPWYRSTVREDHAGARHLDARRRDEPPPKPPDAESALLAALPAVAGRDADLFRAMLDTRCCWATPEEVIARDGMAERIRELAVEPRAMPPGPDRAGALALLAA